MSASTPTVMSRPLTDTEGRQRHNTDAIEVYAPAPPSADPPPGESRGGAERPGQYSVSRKAKEMRETTGRIPVVQPVAPRGPVLPPERAASRSTPPPVRKEPTTPPPVRRESPPTSRPAPPIPHAPPTTGRPLHPTAPISTRGSTATPSAPVPVVMTRPAVIVGAPPKSAAGQRVRKAREDEGRGFGQGLISEKSLDEVILSYLSEDGDEP